MALDEAILGMRAALQRGDLRKARAMRAEAWRCVELLPLAATRKQRHTLGRLKDLLRQAGRKRPQD